MVLIVDVPFFKFDHNLLVYFESHLFFRLSSMNFICEFNKSMKVICLLRSHPITTIHQRSFYHFELLSCYQVKIRVHCLYDKVLQLSV